MGWQRIKEQERLTRLVSVYVFGNAKHGWYKIGMAVRPETDRFSSINAGVPFPLTIFGVWPIGPFAQAKKCESYLHGLFDDKRLPGKREWYSLEEDDLRTIDCLVRPFQRCLVKLEVKS